MIVDQIFDKFDFAQLACVMQKRLKNDGDLKCHEKLWRKKNTTNSNNLKTM